MGVREKVDDDDALSFLSHFYLLSSRRRERERSSNLLCLLSFSLHFSSFLATFNPRHGECYKLSFVHMAAGLAKEKKNDGMEAPEARKRKKTKKKMPLDPIRCFLFRLSDFLARGIEPLSPSLGAREHPLRHLTSLQRRSWMRKGRRQCVRRGCFACPRERLILFSLFSLSQPRPTRNNQKNLLSPQTSTSAATSMTAASVVAEWASALASRGSVTDEEIQELLGAASLVARGEEAAAEGVLSASLPRGRDGGADAHGVGTA